MAITLPWSRTQAPARSMSTEAEHADDMDGLEKFTLIINMAAQGLYVARWYIGDEVIKQTLGMLFLLWAQTIVGLFAGISLDTTAVTTTMGRRRGRYHWLWSNLTVFSAAAFSGLIALQMYGGGIVPPAWLHVANVVAVVCLIQHLSQPRQAPASERQRAASLEQALTAERQATAEAEQRAASLEQQLASMAQGVATVEQIEATARQAMKIKQQEIDRLTAEAAELRQIATSPVDTGDMQIAAMVKALKDGGKSWADLEQLTGANVSRLRRLAASVEGV